MLKPTLGELVGSISRSLREDVLGQVPQGAAQRQLKAALHALDRVELSSGKIVQTLIDDNRDINTTLRDIVSGLETEGASAPADILRALSVDAEVDPDDAKNKDFLGSLIAVNERLQTLLLTLDPWLRELVRQQPQTAQYLTDLNQLYRRMVARELITTVGDEFAAEELANMMQTAQPGTRKK